jgi:hypothetical protein
MKIQMKFPTFPSLLAVLFIGLKLTNHIQWSWLWVLSPIWIGLLLALLSFCLGVALLVIVKLLEK